MGVLLQRAVRSISHVKSWRERSMPRAQNHGHPVGMCMEYSGRNSKKAGVTEADRGQERGTDDENESKEAATGQILYSPGSVLGSNKERNVNMETLLLKNLLSGGRHKSTSSG